MYVKHWSRFEIFDSVFNMICRPIIMYHDWKKYDYIHLRGNCTPNQKLACFVLYFKMINPFLKNNTFTLS